MAHGACASGERRAASGRELWQITGHRALAAASLGRRALSPRRWAARRCAERGALQSRPGEHWREVAVARHRYWHRVRRAAMAAILPPTCCLCGSRGERAGLDLCEICLHMLPANEITTDDRLAAFDAVVVPFAYAYPVNHFVRNLKFNGEHVYARVLGALIADARRAMKAPLPSTVIPVPLHPSRYRTRGFNQAHRLADFAVSSLLADAPDAHHLRVDATSLVRITATQEQSGLSLAERRRNIREAFQVTKSIAAHRVALIDDVLTTGSTAVAAASVLKAAGIREIELWAAARPATRHQRPSERPARSATLRVPQTGPDPWFSQPAHDHRGAPTTN